MANQDSEIEEKSAELQAFDYYMRTGWRLPITMFEAAGERKFNPYHDPDDGRFTFGPGGAGSARMGQGAGGNVPTQQPRSANPRQAQSGGQPKSDPRIQVVEMPGYAQAGRTAWRSSNDAAFIAAANFYNTKGADIDRVT